MGVRISQMKPSISFRLLENLVLPSIFDTSLSSGNWVCGGAKIFGSALLQAARSVCVSPSAFFHLLSYTWNQLISIYTTNTRIIQRTRLAHRQLHRLAIDAAPQKLSRQICDMFTNFKISLNFNNLKLNYRHLSTYNVQTERNNTDTTVEMLTSGQWFSVFHKRLATATRWRVRSDIFEKQNCGCGIQARRARSKSVV